MERIVRARLFNVGEKNFTPGGTLNIEEPSPPGGIGTSGKLSVTRVGERRRRKVPTHVPYARGRKETNRGRREEERRKTQ